MKLLFALLLFCSPVAAETIDIQITAPPNVKPGVPFMVQLDLPKTVGEHYKWSLDPQPQTPAIELQSRGGKPMLWVQGVTKSTRVSVFAQIPQEGLDPIGQASILIVVGDNPDPEPKPDPKPEPDPEPEPKPAGPYWVIVLEESGERTADTARVLGAKKFWDSLTQQGHKWRVYDDDDPKAKAFASLTTHRPALIVLNFHGQVRTVEPLPKTTDEISETLKGGDK